MTRNQARKMAVDFVCDCLGAEAADGHQQHEQADWFGEYPEFGEQTAAGFVVTIGGRRIRFQAISERGTT